ncbi:GGDEF domain-containing protein [Marinomonas sp. TI.3.20]|uniref:GGDEF domain-containing protein n=1 Tax=Marinomonas sp. TI.3.20 TaxID=3121296 RepID=UPI00311D33A3
MVKNDEMEFISIAQSAFNYKKQNLRIFNTISIIGAFTHFAFIFLFLHLEQPTLAWFNVFSVATWIITLWFNKHSRYNASSVIIFIAILTHTILATTTLSAASGFQYYLWPMTLLVVAVPTLPITLSATIASINIIVFGWLSICFEAKLPQLESHYLFLYITNLAMASIPFISVAVVSRYMYENQYLKMAKLAERDDLTQLFNRRFGLRMLQYYFNRLANHDKTFCIALVDVDNFKQINDTLGHSVGDEVLIKISNYLSSTLRDTDICSRWGGEEFLFIMPNVDIEMIEKRLETMCAEMPKQIHIPNWKLPISCSFGLIQAKREEALEDAFKRADRLLYQAKNNGRYQVVSDHSKNVSSD